MAEHEPQRGASDDWYTPREFFDVWRVIFDLDPCSPGPHHWVPALRCYTIADDGLRKPWHGLVFMNPPFGGRFGQVPWLERFVAHGDGIGIVRAYTSSSWWHDIMPQMDAILFPRGKTQFVRPDGSIGKSPGHGIALFARGRRGVDILERSGLGMFWRVNASC